MLGFSGTAIVSSQNTLKPETNEETKKLNASVKKIALDYTTNKLFSRGKMINKLKTIIMCS